MAHEDWNDRRVIVTGGTGFIGWRLSRHLVERGASVCLLSRRAASALLPGMEHLSCDLREESGVKKALAAFRPDIVFHMAGITSASRELGLVMPTLTSNLVATVNVLHGSAEQGVKRVVLAGSMEELPAGTSDQLARVSSPYAAAKYAGAMYGRLFRDLYDLDVVGARIFMVYGPGQADTSKLIPSTILSVLDGRIPEFTSGSRRIDWVHVGDVVDGLAALAMSGNAQGESVDIGSGVLTSVRTVAEKLCELVPTASSPQFGNLPDREREVEVAADVARTKALIGWESSIDLDSGLRETVDWYRSARCSGPDKGTGRLN